MTEVNKILVESIKDGMENLHQVMETKPNLDMIEYYYTKGVQKLLSLLDGVICIETAFDMFSRLMNKCYHTKFYADYVQTLDAIRIQNEDEAKPIDFMVHNKKGLVNILNTQIEK